MTCFLCHDETTRRCEDCDKPVCCEHRDHSFAGIFCWDCGDSASGFDKWARDLINRWVGSGGPKVESSTREGGGRDE